MQVDDPGRFLRSSLNALRYLVELRGMRQLRRDDDDDIDVQQWLRRHEQLERLEEPVFARVARHFVAVSLRHARRTDFAEPVGEKRALARKRAQTRKRKKRARARQTSSAAAAAADDDDASSAVDEDESETSEERALREEQHRAVHAVSRDAPRNRVLFAIDGALLRMERVCEQAREFVPRSEPLLLGSNVARERRVHAAADYNLVLLVHSGFTTAQVNEARQRAWLALERERERRARAFGAWASPEALRAHVFLVLWGSAFHPQSGQHYKRVQRTLRTLNDAAPRTDNVTYEAWSVDELQFDVTQHESVPTHRALTREQALAIDPLLGKVPLHEHRRILDTDPQARAHGFRAGQLLRIERADIKLAGRAVSYAAVVRAEL